MKRKKEVNRSEIENLITNIFSCCPFCWNKKIEFEWGQLVPQKLICRNCGASWFPLMSIDDEGWSFLAAKLVSQSSKGDKFNLINKMHPTDFWRRMCSEKEKEQKLEPETIAKENQKVVIIKEIVKLRCRYCGSLYDEVKDKCPYCVGVR